MVKHLEKVIHMAMSMKSKVGIGIASLGAAYIISRGGGGESSQSFEGNFLTTGISDEHTEQSKSKKSTSAIIDELFDKGISSRPAKPKASHESWDSLRSTAHIYTPPTKKTLASGDYTRKSGAHTILGPSHKDNPYLKLMNR